MSITVDAVTAAYVAKQDERMARLEAQAAALRAVVEALPRCGWWALDTDLHDEPIEGPHSCSRVATWRGVCNNDGGYGCDEHKSCRCGTKRELPWAAALKALATVGAGEGTKT
jgi:hypothetical protein